MAPDLPKVESIEGIRTWILDHHARIEAWWAEQHRFNKKIGDCVGELEKELGGCRPVMESKVKKMAGDIVDVNDKVQTIDSRVHKLEIRLAVIFAVAVILGQIAGHVLARLI